MSQRFCVYQGIYNNVLSSLIHYLHQVHDYTHKFHPIWMTIKDETAQLFNHSYKQIFTKKKRRKKDIIQKKYSPPYGRQTTSLSFLHIRYHTCVGRGIDKKKVVKQYYFKCTNDSPYRYSFVCIFLQKSIICPKQKYVHLIFLCLTIFIV